MRKKFIIFGAGNNAALLIKKMLEHNYLILGIIDNRREKWGSEINGIVITSPERLANMKGENIHILISVSNAKAVQEIMEQLNGLGYQQQRDYSHGVNMFYLFAAPSGHVSGFIELPDDGYDTIKSIDRSSFLMHAKGERVILRVINPGYESRYIKVFEKCKENRLFEQYIVPTEIVDKTEYRPYKYVLSHKYLEPITYCFEWSPEMIRDYVIFMIKMIKKLSECGMALCDGHMLNATVYNGKFCFIDFGALDIGVMKKSVMIEFLDTHLLSLVLILKGELERAYLHMKNPGIIYTPRDIRGYLSDDEFNALMDLYENIPMINGNLSVIDLMEQTEDFIDGIQKMQIKTRWEGYQNDEWEWSTDVSLWSEKMRTVISMIQKVHPDTVTDLAGNMGWYGSYLHDSYKYAVVIDYDTRCVDLLWKRIQEDGIKNVYPVYMSICAPTLDYYRDEMIQGNAIIPWRKNAVDRLGADLVIALAIVHHLAFAQQLTFDEIIAQFCLFTRQYLIVEFIEQSDRYIQDFLKDRFKWYTRNQFEQSLIQKFDIIETGDSTPSETRTVYLCKKKKG